jgi:hypothetical protein
VPRHALAGRVLDFREHEATDSAPPADGAVREVLWRLSARHAGLFYL